MRISASIQTEYDLTPEQMDRLHACFRGEDMHDAHKLTTRDEIAKEAEIQRLEPKHRRPTAAKSRFKSRPKPRRSKR